MPIPHGIGARERADLLDHNELVAKEIRRRGYPVKLHVRHMDAGEVLAIDLVGGDNKES